VRLGLALGLAGALAGAAARAVAEPTFACPPGSIDILDWMTLDADLRSTQHLEGTHELGTRVQDGKFFWLKGPRGDTWDINRFDERGIFLWITERVWGQPADFRKFLREPGLAFAPRCARPGYPGATLRLSDTRYGIFRNCRLEKRDALGTASVQVWGPYPAGHPGPERDAPPIGGIVAAETPVYVIVTRYDCGVAFGSCRDEEHYVLEQRLGLVRHEKWTVVGARGLVLDRRETFDRLADGAIRPEFPCTQAAERTPDDSDPSGFACASPRGPR
jgi:hypothetical protein